MRYLKQLVLNRRIANDPAVYMDGARANFYVNAANSVRLNGGHEVYLNVDQTIYMNAATRSMILPTGSTSARPPGPINGMMRYNTDLNQVEVYQATKWRSLRYKENNQITQQNLGAGDDATVFFGPLNAIYDPTNVSSNNSNYGGQNLLVVVENVIQLSNINYTVVQNPTIGGENYVGNTANVTASGTFTMYFNTSIVCLSAASINGVTTLTFAPTYVDQNGVTQTRPVSFATGTTITVTGFRPLNFNGVFTVTGGTATTVTYLNTFTGSSTLAGTVSATGATPAIYTATSIQGATVTLTLGGSGFPQSTTVASYTYDRGTDALVSVTLSSNTARSIAAGTSITIGEPSRTISDGSYWLLFSSAVPLGKIVTVLLGFDG